MKYWAVPIHVDATGHCVVKANTPEKAMQIAIEGFYPGRDNTELGDAIDALEPIEIDEDDFKKQVYKGREVKEEEQE